MSEHNEQRLSTKLAGIGALTVGLLSSLILGPLYFPRAPGQAISLGQVGCAAAGGALGAALGWAIGRLLERKR